MFIEVFILVIKMFHKSAISVCITGLLCLQGITSVQITSEEREQIFATINRESYETCKHVISEESYLILLDGSDIDNEETRNYFVCVFKDRKWFVKGNFNIDLLLTDVIKIGGFSVTPAEYMAAKLMVNICKNEAEKYANEHDRVTLFVLCVNDRCLSHV